MTLRPFVDFLQQSYYRVKVPFFEWRQQQWVRKYFYSDPLFKALDQELLSGPNPYPIARIFPYGETPLQVLFSIAQKIDLKRTDRFVDLGCGRGRAVFFLSRFFGCQAVGIDLTAPFIATAQQLAKKYQQKKVFFSCQNFINGDFRAATCLYLYGTTYPLQLLLALENRLRTLPIGSRIVTVSQPLYDQSSWQLFAEIKSNYPWGQTQLFFHRKVCQYDAKVCP